VVKLSATETQKTLICYFKQNKIAVKSLKGLVKSKLLLVPGPLVSLESEVTFQSDWTPQVVIHFIVSLLVKFVCFLLACVQDVKPHTH